MKVFCLYPNDTGVTRIAYGFDQVIACIEAAGHEVKLFDTTFYRVFEEDDEERRERLGQVLPTNLSEHISYEPATKDEVIEEIVSSVRTWGPDAIVVSVVEVLLPFTYRIVAALKARFPDLPIMLGGIGVTSAPYFVAEECPVDYLNVGEGEESIVEFLDTMKSGGDLTKIRNVWARGNDGQMITNPLRNLVKLDSLPWHDFKHWDDRHFPRPMRGKIYRMIMYATSRGCVQKCTYCFNDTLKNISTGLGAYLRWRSVDRVMAELRSLIDTHKLNLIFFMDDDFLTMRLPHMEEFFARYTKEIGLPYICQATPIYANNEAKMDLLAKSGCINLCMSIDVGNEFLRYQVVKRKMSRNLMHRSFHVARKKGVWTSSSSIFGFPGETREEIFETIKLGKEIASDTYTVSILMPYRGTEVRRYAEEKGLIDAKYCVPDSLRHVPDFKISALSKKELENLERTFVLYVKCPTWAYPLIEMAEKDERAFEFLYPYLDRLGEQEHARLKETITREPLVELDMEEERQIARTVDLKVKPHLSPLNVPFDRKELFAGAGAASQS